MSAGHTKGPWQVGVADWTENGNARYELRGIKTVSAPDARLIESAPDLLAERDRLKTANAELADALEIFTRKYEAAPDGPLGIGLRNGDFDLAIAALAKNKKEATA